MRIIAWAPALLVCVALTGCATQEPIAGDPRVCEIIQAFSPTTTTGAEGRRRFDAPAIPIPRPVRCGSRVYNRVTDGPLQIFAAAAFSIDGRQALLYVNYGSATDGRQLLLTGDACHFELHAEAWRMTDCWMEWEF